MRFSLWWLLVAVALIAVSIVAVLNANVYWVGTLRTTIILLLSTSLVGGTLAKGPSRAFWAGVGIVGTIHFASVGFAHWRSYGHLITDSAIYKMHGAIAKEYPLEEPGVTMRGAPLKPVMVRLPNLDYFEKAAQCVVTLCAALVGGCVGLSFYNRSNRST